MILHRGKEMNASSSCSLSSPSASSSSFSSSADVRGIIQCIPRILRCFGVLPWGGGLEFDQLGEEQQGGTCTTSASLVCGPAAPGIVARLMGLESLPRVKKTQNQSRSLKMSGFSDYQELEDDKFFILSFEHRSLCRRREGSRGMKKENKEMDMVYGRNSYCSGCRRNSNSSLHISSHGIPSDNNNQNLVCSIRNSRRKPRKRRERKLKYDGDNEDESDNSSPNSVLKFTKFSSQNQETTPSGSKTHSSSLYQSDNNFFHILHQANFQSRSTTPNRRNQSSSQLQLQARTDGGTQPGNNTKSASYWRRKS